MSEKKYIPDPKHVEEWERIQENFRNINTDEMKYRVRCIEGLITGDTLNYKGN